MDLTFVYGVRFVTFVCACTIFICGLINYLRLMIWEFYFSTANFVPLLFSFVQIFFVWNIVVVGCYLWLDWYIDWHVPLVLISLLVHTVISVTALMETIRVFRTWIVKPKTLSIRLLFCTDHLINIILFFGEIYTSLSSLFWKNYAILDWIYDYAVLWNNWLCTFKLTILIFLETAIIMLLRERCDCVLH